MYDNGNSQLNTFKHCILLMYISIRAIIFTAYVTTLTCAVFRTWTMLTSGLRGLKRTIKTILQYSLVVFRSLIRVKA